uniref:Uncharacterized protein n=1 Tax=Arundo donax TaxID=35708 RepID=A0A0A9AV88_ARUDO
MLFCLDLPSSACRCSVNVERERETPKY